MPQATAEAVQLLWKFDGVLQKFRAGSDVAVAEFVQIPIEFPYGSPRNTSQALSGAVFSETEGRVFGTFY